MSEWFFLAAAIVCIGIPVWAMLYLDDDNAES